MPKIICSEEMCTGCGACFNICPKDCIRMISDAEGFFRPKINCDCCDDCGMCKRVCPVINPHDPKNSTQIDVYACWNKDENIRFQSASGGMFSVFAMSIIEKGGVVFGAAFDNNMRLRHIAVERKEDLVRLRSSKYVQSDINSIYSDVREYLKQNRKILFSGTPCQVAGLYMFLGKDNDNLLTCDMLCHGVPSPGLYQKYVGYLERSFNSTLCKINMRSKRKSWHIASTIASFSDGKERVLEGKYNSFMYGFINCITLRPACYKCAHTKVYRQGDITLGDFWGIGEKIPFKHNTRNGISLILVNSDKGHKIFDECSNLFYSEKRTIEEAKYKSRKFSHPFPEPDIRRLFFLDYQRLDFEKLIGIYLVDKGMKGFIKRVIPQTWIFYLRKYINL